MCACTHENIGGRKHLGVGARDAPSAPAGVLRACGGRSGTGSFAGPLRLDPAGLARARARGWICRAAEGLRSGVGWGDGVGDQGRRRRLMTGFGIEWMEAGKPSGKALHACVKLQMKLQSFSYGCKVDVLFIYIYISI